MEGEGEAPDAVEVPDAVEAQEADEVQDADEIQEAPPINRENDTINADNDDEEADEETVKNRINNEGRMHKHRRGNSPPCRTRVDYLATPNRRLILDLYQRHAHHLSLDKVERIKEMLQELYAMTPEETKRYFMDLEQENLRKKRRKKLKDLLRKQYMKQKKQQETAKAYKTFANILRKGMIFAYTHPVPPVVSIRLRNLSDIVLEQICDLRNVSIPSRDDPDKEGVFLIAVADWMAIGIEQVYYDVQVKKNEELEKLEKERGNLQSEVKEEVSSPPETTESKLKQEEEVRVIVDPLDETDDIQWE